MIGRHWRPEALLAEPDETGPMDPVSSHRSFFDGEPAPLPASLFERTRSMSLNVSREPSLIWIGFLAPGVQLLAAFVFAANPTLQGVINAAAAAIAGAVVAYLVKAEDLVALMAGAVQAVLAVVLAFGVHLDSTQQASIMAFAGLVIAVAVRDRVVAPAPALA